MDQCKILHQVIQSKLHSMNQKLQTVIPLYYLKSLFYNRERGEEKLCNTDKNVNWALPDNYISQIVYTRTKLGSQFNIKDLTKIEHTHDLAYSVKCPEKNWEEVYSGEAGRRSSKRVEEHRGKSKIFHAY